MTAHNLSSANRTTDPGEQTAAKWKHNGKWKQSSRETSSEAKKGWHPSNRQLGTWRDLFQALVGWLSYLKMPHVDSSYMKKGDRGTKSTVLKSYKCIFNFCVSYHPITVAQQGNTLREGRAKKVERLKDPNLIHLTFSFAEIKTVLEMDVFYKFCFKLVFDVRIYETIELHTLITCNMINQSL